MIKHIFILIFFCFGCFSIETLFLTRPSKKQNETLTIIPFRMVQNKAILMLFWFCVCFFIFILKFLLFILNLAINLFMIDEFSKKKKYEKSILSDSFARTTKENFILW